MMPENDFMSKDFKDLLKRSKVFCRPVIIKRNGTPENEKLMMRDVIMSQFVLIR